MIGGEVMKIWYGTLIILYCHYRLTLQDTKNVFKRENLQYAKLICLQC